MGKWRGREVGGLLRVSVLGCARAPPGSWLGSPAAPVHLRTGASHSPVPQPSEPPQPSQAPTPASHPAAASRPGSRAHRRPPAVAGPSQWAEGDSGLDGSGAHAACTGAGCWAPPRPRHAQAQPCGMRRRPLQSHAAAPSTRFLFVPGLSSLHSTPATSFLRGPTCSTTYCMLALLIPGSLTQTGVTSCTCPQ